MSNAALKWAFPIPIRGAKKNVLVAMADHADENGMCWPSVARLALFAGVTTRGVQLATAELEALGLVRVERSLGRATSRYELIMTATIIEQGGNSGQIQEPNHVKTPYINPEPNSQIITSTAKEIHGSRIIDSERRSVLDDPNANEVQGCAESNLEPSSPQPRTTFTTTTNPVHPNHELRSQTLNPVHPNPKEPLKNPQLTLSEPSLSERPPTDVFSEAVVIWNSVCSSNPAAMRHTDKRRRAFNARFKDELGSDIENWRGFCEAVAASDFMCGRTPKTTFQATFDWAVNPSNMIKVLEGNYTNRKAVNAKSVNCLDYVDEYLGDHEQSDAIQSKFTIDQAGNPVPWRH